MRLLIDTNILVRLDHIGHLQRETAKRAIDSLHAGSHELRTVPQVWYEYWAVATRPTEVNGLGLSISDAQRLSKELIELFPPFRDERGILEQWEEIVVQYSVRGKSTHDARLVAAMLRHGVTHLLTFDETDFARFDEVSVVTPDSVLSGTAELT